MSVWELDTAIKPSRYQQWLNGLFYSVAMAAIWCAYLPTVAQLGLTIVLLAVACLHSVKLAKTLPVVSHLSSKADDWFIELATGQRLKVKLNRYFLWRYLVVLSYQSPHIRVPYVVVIFPDSIDKDNYRRLQAKLRLSLNS